MFSFRAPIGLTAFALAATFGASTAFADATSGIRMPHADEDPSLAPCQTHGKNTNDCHIHDETIYLHMVGDKPGEHMPHAWMEYRNWERYLKKKRSN